MVVNNVSVTTLLKLSFPIWSEKEPASILKGVSKSKHERGVKSTV